MRPGSSARPPTISYTSPTSPPLTRFPCAPPVTQLGRETVYALESEMDQSVETDRGIRGSWLADSTPMVAHDTSRSHFHIRC